MDEGLFGPAPSEIHLSRLRLEVSPTCLADVVSLQRQAKLDDVGLVNFVPALAYHFCLNLPAAFTQPGASHFSPSLYARHRGRKQIYPTSKPSRDSFDILFSRHVPTKHLFFSLSVFQDRVLPAREPAEQPGPVHVHRVRRVLERQQLQPHPHARLCTGKEKE